jgi:hypothetical protein
VGLLQYYSELFAWPITIDPKTGEIHLQLGETVDAVTMRAGFAAEVNNVLAKSFLTGPVIVVPGNPADWVFITQGRTPLRRSTVDDLVRIQVGWNPVGATIPLPALVAGHEGPRWLERPKLGSALPPWTAVIGAARRASSLCGTW